MPFFRNYASFPSKPHPFDEARPLEARARSYLDANCSHCHRPGVVERGMDLRFDTPLEHTGLLDWSTRTKPGGGPMRHVEPGDPQASEVYLRMASLGSDGMPPSGRTQVDEQGLELIRAWIGSLAADTVKSPAAPARISLHIHHRDGEALEIGPAGLNPEGNPVFRICDAKGEEVAGVAVSFRESSGRRGWTLRFSRPLPRGRYWMHIEWEGGRTMRDFLVL